MVACKPILAAQPTNCAARIRAALASLAKQLAFGSQLASLGGAPSVLKAKAKTVRSFVAHSSLALVKRNSNG